MSLGERMPRAAGVPQLQGTKRWTPAKAAASTRAICDLIARGDRQHMTMSIFFSKATRVSIGSSRFQVTVLMPRCRIRMEAGLLSDDVRMKQVRSCSILEVSFRRLKEKKVPTKDFSSIKASRMCLPVRQWRQQEAHLTWSSWMDGKDVDDAVLCWKWDIVLAGSGINLILCISILRQRSLLTEGSGHHQQPQGLDRECSDSGMGVSKTIEIGLATRRQFVRAANPIPPRFPVG